MTKNPLYVLEVDSVGRVEDLLRNCTHQGFPVVTAKVLTEGASPQFRGLILRRHLVMLLKERAFFNYPPKPYETNAILTNNDLEKLYPRYPTIEDIHLSDEDRKSFLDLTPYMNAGPFVVHEHALATRAFRLFRTMGLRHLPVVCI